MHFGNYIVDGRLWAGLRVSVFSDIGACAAVSSAAVPVPAGLCTV